MTRKSDPSAGLTRRAAGAGLLGGGVMGAGLLPWRAVAADAPAERQTYFMFVFANPTPGMEAEFNRYYDEVHAREVLEVPGFVSCQRMIYSEVQLREVPLKKPRYLAMFTIETDDLGGVIAENQRRLASNKITPSDSFDKTTSLNYLYRAVGPIVHGHTPQPAKAKPGPKQTYYQLVFGDPKPGMEDAFNRWYDEVHNPELGNSPGFTLARRGVYAERQYRPNADPTKYVAIYGIETSDIAATLDARAKGAAPAEANDPNRTFGYTYKALGPPFLAKR